MNILYLLQGLKTVLKIGTPILMTGKNPIKAADFPTMKGIASIVVHVPPYGAAHEAVVALLESGAPALWCLSKDAANTPPGAARGKFRLPSTWSFLPISARVHEVKERITAGRPQITVTIAELIGEPTKEPK